MVSVVKRIVATVKVFTLPLIRFNVVVRVLILIVSVRAPRNPAIKVGICTPDVSRRTIYGLKKDIDARTTTNVAPDNFVYPTPSTQPILRHFRRNKSLGWPSSVSQETCPGWWSSTLRHTERFLREIRLRCEQLPRSQPTQRLPPAEVEPGFFYFGLFCMRKLQSSSVPALQHTQGERTCTVRGEQLNVRKFGPYMGK